MNFIDAVSTCFGKYVTFSGRARRAEYWWFTLFVTLGSIVMDALGETAGAIFSLAVFLPSISVSVRRLHDIDRSGWWWWLLFVPLVGIIVLIIWFATKGTDGPNSYGDDPLEHTGTESPL